MKNPTVSIVPFHYKNKVAVFCYFFSKDRGLSFMSLDTPVMLVPEPDNLGPRLRHPCFPRVNLQLFPATCNAAFGFIQPFPNHPGQRRPFPVLFSQGAFVCVLCQEAGLLAVSVDKQTITFTQCYLLGSISPSYITPPLSDEVWPFFPPAIGLQLKCMFGR